MSDTDDEPKRPVVHVGGVSIPVEDPDHLPALYADLITEFRIVDGVVILSLAAGTVDGTGGPVARVACRLRFPLSVYLDLKRGVETTLAEAEKAKQNAN